ncbi:unnamed protein product [Closterium sp. NIES-64]|nr:unnamed protein product [Closterium sp. NIES-65]CAI5987505.1 unnamed protein product [Closterium sp. NIES-64]
MAAERVMGTLIDVVKEAVLAAVREELAAHKEEVDELQNMMIAVEERNAATAAAMGRELAAVKGELAAHKEEEGDELRHTLTVLEERYEATVAVMEERGSKLAAVKREVTAVKGELAGVKSWLGEHLQLEEADRRRVAEMREMRRQGGGRGKELAAESAPVKGELAEHKQSTMLEQDKAVRRQMAEMRGQVEERERDLTAVKGGLVEIKDAMAEQVIMAERIRQLDLRELREEARKGNHRSITGDPAEP